MSAQIDHTFMHRAIALAMLGRGGVEPNPTVGCVIVRDGRVIGEGYHERFGQPHAEPNALNACIEPPRGATAYITLEPCCHTNKKTPPCVPSLIAAGLQRIVVGTLDPNPAVNGTGLQQLQQAGIEVSASILESACRQLIAPFIGRVTFRRPYVTLKWAQTADGHLAGPMGARLAISSPRSVQLVHELRSRCDAILVGVKTVLNDDPLLTARPAAPAMRPLLRCVLDPHLVIPLTSRLLTSATPESPVLLFCLPESLANLAPPAHVHLVPVEPEAGRPGRLRLRAVLEQLAERGATHLLVEPGPGLIRAFLSANLADRLWIFRSADRLDDPSAPAAPPISLPATGELPVSTDRLTEYLNPQGELFFCLAESADLHLARRSLAAPADR